MFNQISLQDNKYTLFRKNQTYRLMIEQRGESEVFAIELPVNIMLRLLAELKRLRRKDLNLRPVEWEINNYLYTVNPTWPFANSDTVWISYTHVDKDGVEKDCICHMTFDNLGKFIKFLTDVNEL